MLNSVSFGFLTLGQTKQEVLRCKLLTFFTILTFYKAKLFEKIIDKLIDAENGYLQPSKLSFLFFRLKVSCYYDINKTHAVAFRTRPRRSEPYAENARGELQVAMRLALGNGRSDSIVFSHAMFTFCFPTLGIIFCLPTFKVLSEAIKARSVLFS